MITKGNDTSVYDATVIYTGAKTCASFYTQCKQTRLFPTSNDVC